MITAERLREVLSYDEETGLFRWLKKSSSKSHARLGDIAGYKPDGDYTKIQIDGRLYQAHRLAWLYMTGAWPRSGIDHFDLDKANNKWSNLREATKSQNAANMRGRSQSGLKGAFFESRTRRWFSTIRINGIALHLGTFPTPEDAHTAYSAAAREHFGEFARPE